MMLRNINHSIWEARISKPLFSCILLSLVWLTYLSYSSLQRIHKLSHSNSTIPKSIFILAGQSNVSGRGGVVNGTWEGVVPPECQVNPSVLRLSAGLKWEEAREPLHRDIDVGKSCGIGPGMAFSNSVLDRVSGFGMIGLVPCAVGGTNISEWGRGEVLYNRMMTRARAAVLGGGLIRAVLWYQGETDTIDLENAKLYKMRLEKFFTDLRSDLQSPILPVIQVALASGEGPYVDLIRKAQMEIDLPNVGYVDAFGLQLQPDGLHLATGAQIRLGGMLAEAFLRGMASVPAVQSNSAARRLNNFFMDFLFRWFR